MDMTAAFFATLAAMLPPLPAVAARLFDWPEPSRSTLTALTAFESLALGYRPH